MGYGSPAAIHAARGFLSVFLYPFQQFKQGKMTFRQVSAFCNPVIHFRIDIYGKFAVPGRRQAFIPDPLQVCRQASFPAGSDQQISSVLEIE